MPKLGALTLRPRFESPQLGPGYLLIFKPRGQLLKLQQRSRQFGVPQLRTRLNFLMADLENGVTEEHLDA